MARDDSKRRLQQWRIDAMELIHEITATAGRIARARDWGGEQILRHVDASWVITLLNGLETRETRRTAEILRVIRQRLARDERERAIR